MRRRRVRCKFADRRPGNGSILRSSAYIFYLSAAVLPKGDMITPDHSTKPEPITVLIMGVAGSGKTTIGSAVALALGWSFRDADEFHSAANVTKMTLGIPLTDQDRMPWLTAIRAHITTCHARGENAIVTCSALRERYRAALIGPPANVRLVYLSGSFDVIHERLKLRIGHFMRPELLRSQFETVESPTNALLVDLDQSVEAIVKQVCAHLRQST